MTQFKVGDQVQLVRPFGGLNRRTKGEVLQVLHLNAVVMLKDNTKKPIPLELLRPYTPRVRPSKSDITKLKQEIAIRNEAIDRLENDVRILHSEKVRLGELNAHLTSVREVLEFEAKEMERAMEIDSTIIQSYISQIRNHEHAQAQTALSLYIWKAAAVVAVVADLVLLGILIWG